MKVSAARLRGSTWELRLGTMGYLSCLVFSLVVAVLAQGWRVSLACGLVVALAVAFYPIVHNLHMSADVPLQVVALCYH